MVFVVPIESELSQMVLASLPSVILFMLSSLFFHFMYKQAKRRDVVTQL
ncbi:hypothetical protein PRUB_a2818 [Pseudoalteromonas rubra]|uniref:Uncharacterized protein n=1 Tax=Pseudoalteromonas rubra TaxID=43658 RepID=A0A8T0CDY1_9GAMM|nr:hypothetical protein PRUB_a2818 [Pseudoalteromonas rubra]